MKGLLVTVGIMGVCSAMPTNVEVMPSSSGGGSGLPPVQSGMPDVRSQFSNIHYSIFTISGWQHRTLANKCREYDQT